MPGAIFQNYAITVDLRIESPFTDIMFKTDARHKSSGGLHSGNALHSDERGCSGRREVAARDDRQLIVQLWDMFADCKMDELATTVKLARLPRETRRETTTAVELPDRPPVSFIVIRAVTNGSYGARGAEVFHSGTGFRLSHFSRTGWRPLSPKLPCRDDAQRSYGGPPCVGLGRFTSLDPARTADSDLSRRLR
jgi:hypothetical protein